MIAEYLVNAASMARAFSGYINSLTGDAMFDLFKEKLWWGNEGLFGHFPNFPALGLVILAAIIVGLGVRESKTFMDAMTSINGAALVSAIVAGAVLSDPSNWSSMDKFAPNGVSGILMAAPSCFYCLSGFDAIPTASEEALDPRHDVPKAIMWSLGISLVAYIAVITVQTLMVPYTDLTYYAPLAEAFKSRGLYTRLLHSIHRRLVRHIWKSSGYDLCSDAIVLLPGVRRAHIHLHRKGGGEPSHPHNVRRLHGCSDWYLGTLHRDEDVGRVGVGLDNHYIHHGVRVCLTLPLPDRHLQRLP
ncbi:hypothetical protein QZH41_006596 [Actinostola sp. cb2023]|nr:hypothetical protein QZH41_006596 [Actinostola sp. cb2023]